MTEHDADALIRRWLRPELLARQAYAVADPAGLIKLDAMENPYGWPPAMRAAWLETLRGVPLNRYPDAACEGLKRELGAAVQSPPGAAAVLGNGSDELIQLLALAFAAPGRVLLAPEPGFVMYRMIAAATGMRYVGVDLGADFALNLPGMLEALERERPALVFLAYPNNPSGNLFASDEVRAIVRRAPGLVVLDEAYFPFARRSFLSELGEHPNLVVLRTLSKMGLAGLRFGALFATAPWAAQLEKLRLPYNINSLTQASVSFALRHLDVFDAQAERICADRERLAQALGELPGVRVWPSAANFLLLRLSADAPRVCAGLHERGVLVKDVSAAHPLTAGCLRVTVGEPQENQALLVALRAALGD